MAEFTLGQLTKAARAAGAAGDTDREHRLRLKAKQMLQQQQGGGEPEVDKPWYEDAKDAYYDFGRGVSQGAVNMGRSGQELWARGKEATGFATEEETGDRLDQINNRREFDAARNKHFSDRSGFAFGAGEFTGAVAATLPVGGVGGVAARGAGHALSLTRLGRPMLKGTKKAGALTLAGEGAAVGVLEDGGENPMGAAAGGAALDLVGGAALNQITREFGTQGRKWANRKQAEGEVGRELRAAGRRVNEADIHGGYKLDGIDAASTQAGFSEETRLLADPQMAQRMAEHKARQNADITTRAGEMAGNFGDFDAESIVETAQKGAAPLQRRLRAMRRLDEYSYRKLYKQFDELAAQSNTHIDPSSLTAGLTDLKKYRSDADRAFIESIDRDLAQFGIGPGAVPEPSPILGPNGKPIGPAPSAGQAPSNGTEPGMVNFARGETPLTLENAENLVQMLNDRWSPNMSRGKSRYITELKSSLTKFIDDSLEQVGERAGVGAEVYHVGKAAREARKAFSDNWDKDTLMTKLTERTEGGEYAMDYTKAMSSLTGKDGHRNLQKVKTRLKLNTRGGQKAWKSMQQAPLLEALYQATKDGIEQIGEGGQVIFNDTKYTQAINRALKTEDAKKVLWGEEFADDAKRSMKAWELRNRRADVSGSANPSGTALTFLKQMRFFPSGIMRNIGMASAGVADHVSHEVSTGVRTGAMDTILKGQQLPQRTQDEMVARVLAHFEDEYVGTNKQKYGNALRYVLRHGGLHSILDQDEE